MGRLTWESSMLTDVGCVREVNEDALLDRAHEGLWVVADGMGGHAAGDFASGLVVRTLATTALAGEVGQRGALIPCVDALEADLYQVNERICAEGRRLDDIIGTTVVAMVARAEGCVVCWVGDSRLYRSREGHLDQLTHDHTEAEELIDEGAMTRSEAQADASADVLTRAVGSDADLYPDMDYFVARPGDTYLMCSDGLVKEVDELEIAEALADCVAPEETARLLLDLALERGATDNVTLGIIRSRGD